MGDHFDALVANGKPNPVSTVSFHQGEQER
jgi:hypothetical protein